MKNAFMYLMVCASLAISLMLGVSPSHAADGAKVFNKCKACHNLAPGKNGVGPSLAGVIGRKAGTAPGFKNYKGLKGANWIWAENSIAEYLKNPSAYTKDKTGQSSAMALKLTKEDEIKAVIEYLKGK